MQLSPDPFQGDVLELSAGTGRNMPYWPWDRITSLTVTDGSRHMMYHARKKVHPSYMHPNALLDR